MNVFKNTFWLVALVFLLTVNIINLFAEENETLKDKWGRETGLTLEQFLDIDSVYIDDLWPKSKLSKSERIEKMKEIAAYSEKKLTEILGSSYNYTVNILGKRMNIKAFKKFYDMGVFHRDYLNYNPYLEHAVWTDIVVIAKVDSIIVDPTPRVFAPTKFKIKVSEYIVDNNLLEDKPQYLYVNLTGRFGHSYSSVELNLLDLYKNPENYNKSKSQNFEYEQFADSVIFFLSRSNVNRLIKWQTEGYSVDFVSNEIAKPHNYMYTASATIRNGEVAHNNFHGLPVLEKNPKKFIDKIRKIGKLNNKVEFFNRTYK